jgi:hypothetical protein
MANFLGGQSGFKTGRDLALFMVGLVILAYHLATTSSDKLSVPLLIFCGTMMGAPYVLGRDESKSKGGD